MWRLLTEWCSSMLIYVCVYVYCAFVKPLVFICGRWSQEGLLRRGFWSVCRRARRASKRKSSRRLWALTWLRYVILWSRVSSRCCSPFEIPSLLILLPVVLLLLSPIHLHLSISPTKRAVGRFTPSQSHNGLAIVRLPSVTAFEWVFFTVEVRGHFHYLYPRPISLK